MTRDMFLKTLVKTAKNLKEVEVEISHTNLSKDKQRNKGNFKDKEVKAPSINL